MGIKKIKGTSIKRVQCKGGNFVRWATCCDRDSTEQFKKQHPSGHSSGSAFALLLALRIHPGAAQLKDIATYRLLSLMPTLRSVAHKKTCSNQIPICHPLYCWSISCVQDHQPSNNGSKLKLFGKYSIFNQTRV